MRNAILTLIILIAATLSSLDLSRAHTEPDQPVASSSETAVIPPVLRNTPNVHVDPSPMEGLRQVTAGRNIFYISPDGQYLVIGRLLRAADGYDLTADAEQAALRPFFHALIDAAPIRWGEGPRQLLVFLDPDCPFCRKVWPALRALTQVKVAVHLLGRPSSLAPILCGTEPLAALERHFQLGPQPGPLCHRIEESRQWTTLAHVQGTPAFLNDRLEWRHGLQTLEDLQAWSTPPTSSVSEQGVTP